MRRWLANGTTRPRPTAGHTKPICTSAGDGVSMRRSAQALLHFRTKPGFERVRGRGWTSPLSLHGLSQTGVRSFQHGRSPARISENNASASDGLVDRRLPGAVRSSLYPARCLCWLSDAEVIDLYTAGNARRLTRMFLNWSRLRELLQGAVHLQGSAFPSFAALLFLPGPVLAAQFRVPRAPGCDRWLAKPAGAVALF